MFSGQGCAANLYSSTLKPYQVQLHLPGLCLHLLAVGDGLWKRRRLRHRTHVQVRLDKPRGNFFVICYFRWSLPRRVCRPRILCSALSGHTCGDYTVSIGNTEVCETGRIYYAAGDALESGDQLAVRVWHQGKAEAFNAKCYLWCGDDALEYSGGGNDVQSVLFSLVMRHLKPNTVARRNWTFCSSPALRTPRDPPQVDLDLLAVHIWRRVDRTPRPQRRPCVQAGGEHCGESRLRWRCLFLR